MAVVMAVAVAVVLWRGRGRGRGGRGLATFRGFPDRGAFHHPTLSQSAPYETIKGLGLVGTITSRFPLSKRLTWIV